MVTNILGLQTTAVVSKFVPADSKQSYRVLNHRLYTKVRRAE